MPETLPYAMPRRPESKPPLTSEELRRRQLISKLIGRLLLVLVPLLCVLIYGL